MKQIEYFVPGVSGADEGILSHLRWPMPGGVADEYVATYTEPEEWVLVPYCQGPIEVHGILSAGRRALALNFDPLLIALVRTELAPPPMRELDAAVARLGDSPKQGMPLRRYLAGLYATACPACLRPAVADYFLWDRDQGQPIAKYVRCPACGWDGRAAVEAEDREHLDKVPARGMHYHYVLDRVAPPTQADALRPRLEYLLELYSQRNLYALAELTLKIESLFPEGPLQQALQVLLLDCLDRCSSLAPLSDGAPRRRSLARPGRFLERNVWYAFEEAVARMRASAQDRGYRLASTLETFVTQEGEWAGFVGQGMVRDLPRALPSRNLRLILTSPPSLDSTVWSLSYLWGAWLLGASAVVPLRSLLRQRTPDPSWYARVMGGSLHALAELLRDDGRLVLVLTGQRRAVVEALVLAASQARLGVASLVQRGNDYRMELVPAFFHPVVASDQALDVQIRRVAVEACVETIRARGEPVPWLTLHASIQQRLAGTGVLTRALETEAAEPSPLDLAAEQIEAALDDARFVRLPATESHQELWWLAHPRDVAPPLCDRVEAVAYQVLQGALALTETDFAARVYSQFPGGLTPEGELVVACLHAYGGEPTPGFWQLRQEDLPGARQAEQKIIVEHLLLLGQRLGYQTKVWDPFDAAWFAEGQQRAVFVVRWQAAIGEALALRDRVAGARPYLVIPGGRAALVSHKLAHNPLWQRAVDEDGWWFIKYRHVRQLVDQPEVDEYTLRTIVGLDPIVEQESAQLPLF